MKQIEINILQILLPKQAWHYKAIPFTQDNSSIHFYTISENKAIVEEELFFLLNKKIEITLLKEEEVQELLLKYYRIENEKKYFDNDKLHSSNEDDLLIKIINEAKSLDSSDIHIESYEYKCRIRYRIDGELIDRYTIKKEEYPSLINKIKIKAHLDISEKRLPQDGRILMSVGNEKIDIRVSVLPTLFGEKCVMRILNNDIAKIDLRAVGMSEEQVNLYEQAIQRPNGIILISGPTGSGKTTTLYSTLKLLNKSNRNILTIEDPVEYTIEGVNQVPLKESIGLTFPKALRSFLRQDPDIIMVGEIRDKETAEMAIRASLTGHLVLSSIHTNSALGTINRLIDMDVPRFLIADTLVLSIAQRLVRLLCTYCKKEVQTTAQEKQLILAEHHYESVGCDACYHTGYKGRIGVFEMIAIDNSVKDAIRKNEHDIYTLKNKTLKDNALELVNSGKTSLVEVASIIK